MSVSRRPGQLVGQRIGNCEIIAYTGARRPSYKGDRRERPVLRLRCDCSEEFDALHAELKGLSPARCPTCRADRHTSAKIGDVFDQLTIVAWAVRVVGQSEYRDRAVCRCSCGNTTTIRITSLRANITNDCGCRPNGAWKGAGDLPGTYMCRLRRSASDRNLEMTVTKEFLWELFLRQGSACALSGLPIVFARNATKDEGTASLDRVDSQQGYVPGNVQWVHKDVNLLKMDFPEPRLLELCRLIVATSNKKLDAILCDLVEQHLVTTERA